MNEIASAPPGVTKAAIDRVAEKERQEEPASKPAPMDEDTMEIKGVQQSVASVRRDGKVEFQHQTKTQ